MIRGLLFDLNGTVIDILTDENDYHVYRVTSNFLSYYGIMISPDRLKELFFELNRQQRKTSGEEFPEFDVEKIFRDIFKSCGVSDCPEHLAATAAIVFRSASRHQLIPYPDVCEVLTQLQANYCMGALSDGQSLWAVPELRAAGLEKFFSFTIVSGDHGFRKPDKRMYEMALQKIGLNADEVLFVGNDMYRDVYGAHEAGMKTVFFRSNQGDHSSHGVEADYIIYHFSELPRAIAFLQGKG
ncbi:MAG: HAD family hydrolase [Lentisphaeria bacterium]|nr:HAD family hydrolase [Lentisphaeria bacterium]